MFIIGLTGGIASGKTTVANILRQLGAIVLDADRVARKVTEKGQPAYREIIREFGRGVLTEKGEINRKKLAELIFDNEEKRKKLEDIIHPRVKNYFKREIKKIRESRKNKVVVLDVPLLIESGMNFMVDEIWVVAASKQVQLKRLNERDRLDEEEARKRIKAQMPLEKKLRFADRVINTEGSLEETKKQVITYWNEINK